MLTCYAREKSFTYFLTSGWPIWGRDIVFCRMSQCFGIPSTHWKPDYQWTINGFLVAGFHTTWISIPIQWIFVFSGSARLAVQWMLNEYSCWGLEKFDFRVGDAQWISVLGKLASTKNNIGWLGPTCTKLHLNMYNDTLHTYPTCTQRMRGLCADYARATRGLCASPRGDVMTKCVQLANTCKTSQCKSVHIFWFHEGYLRTNV